MQIANTRLDRTRTHALRIAYLENMDIIMNPLFVAVTRPELVKYVAANLSTNRCICICMFQCMVGNKKKKMWRKRTNYILVFPILKAMHNP
nr:unknown [Arabidopsis thaliana]